MPAHLIYNAKNEIISYDRQGLIDSVRLIARHNLRITNVDLSKELPRWHETQRRDRLCGTALSGLVDFKDSLRLDNQQMAEILEELREITVDEVNSYADEMGINRPLLITTIKPSGSLSLLPGISPGAHPPIAPYFWRRIRIGKNDGVARALAYMGVPYEAEMHQVRSKAKSKGLTLTDAFTPTSNESIELADTLVFSFPAKSNGSTRSAKDHTAIEQLEFYKMTMQSWTQHNTSVTIYVAKHEVEAVGDWLLQNWDYYVGVSFLPKDDTVYEQAPYEEITQQEYEVALAAFPNMDDLEETLWNIEASGVTFSDIAETCENGVCPVR